MGDPKLSPGVTTSVYQDRVLQSYTQLLQSILEYYKIDYPSIQLEEDIDF